MYGCGLWLKLSVNPGVKGTTLLFGEPPTWLSYTSSDKVEVSRIDWFLAAAFPCFFCFGVLSKGTIELCEICGWNIFHTWVAIVDFLGN